MYSPRLPPFNVAPLIENIHRTDVETRANAQYDKYTFGFNSDFLRQIGVVVVDINIKKNIARI